MELGKKLLLARQEAGLSQRQLCADVITRNMLSQIEHGTARPSMETLGYLAGRLGKPVSYFLEEDVVTSPNQALMAEAMAHYAAGESRESWQTLTAFQQPDPVLEWQWRYLSAVTALDAARQALAQGKDRYARELLEACQSFAAMLPELERQRLLLLGSLPQADLAAILSQLPSLDAELLLRAEGALEAKDPERALSLLAAAERQDMPRWQLLQGRALLLKKQYAAAAAQLEQAEAAYPGICPPLLERCFREMGDFQRAYFYACKQRE